MPYDDGLLERCLDALRGTHAGTVRHKNVFGMRGLLRDGRMFAAVGESSIVVKLTPAAYVDALSMEGVSPFSPGGSALGKWVEVPADAVADDPDLRAWLDAGLRSLG